MTLDFFKHMTSVSSNMHVKIINAVIPNHNYNLSVSGFSPGKADIDLGVTPRTIWESIPVITLQSSEKGKPEESKNVLV